VKGGDCCFMSGACGCMDRDMIVKIATWIYQNDGAYIESFDKCLKDMSWEVGKWML
jgi:hypothetical protein